MLMCPGYQVATLSLEPMGPSNKGDTRPTDREEEATSREAMGATQGKSQGSYGGYAG